jgi:hypothetical protein
MSSALTPIRGACQPYCAHTWQLQFGRLPAVAMGDRAGCRVLVEGFTNDFSAPRVLRAARKQSSTDSVEKVVGLADLNKSTNIRRWLGEATVRYSNLVIVSG